MPASVLLWSGGDGAKLNWWIAEGLRSRVAALHKWLNDRRLRASVQWAEYLGKKFITKAYFLRIKSMAQHSPNFQYSIQEIYFIIAMLCKYWCYQCDPIVRAINVRTQRQNIHFQWRCSFHWHHNKGIALDYRWDSEPLFQSLTISSPANKSQTLQGQVTLHTNVHNIWLNYLIVRTERQKFLYHTSFIMLMVMQDTCYSFNWQNASDLNILK